jgi:hypothetical protein
MVRFRSHSPYLLGVGDIARQGALRFALAEGGPFLAAEDASQIPALVKLPDLLTAAMRIRSRKRWDIGLNGVSGTERN